MNKNFTQICIKCFSDNLMKTWRVPGSHALKRTSVSNLYYFMYYITNELIFLLSRAVANKRNVINVSKQMKFYASGDKVRGSLPASFELTIWERVREKSRCKIWWLENFAVSRIIFPLTFFGSTLVIFNEAPYVLLAGTHTRRKGARPFRRASMLLLQTASFTDVSDGPTNFSAKSARIMAMQSACDEDDRTLARRLNFWRLNFQ